MDGKTAKVIEGKGMDVKKLIIALVAEGHEKDVYELISVAVRHYFQHRLGLHHDLTINETVSRLRKEKHPDLDEVKECLHLCSMVEFAKY